MKKEIIKKPIKKYKNLEELEKDISTIKWHWWEYIEMYWYKCFWNWFTDLKWRIPTWWQRSFHGWGYADTWNLNAHLARVIYGSLVHLKKYKHGHPIILPLKDPNNEKELKTNEKLWNEIEDKMIYAFKLAKEIGDGEREYYCPKMSKKFQIEYKCLTKEEDERMKEGMKLFIEHFFDLWD